MCLTDKIAAFCGIGMLFLSHLSFALKADREEKVHIIADSIIYNYKTGVDTYQGHVQVDQGTTHITGDRLITKNNVQHKMVQATAYGTNPLAHYWTLPNEKDPPIDAKAHIIIFYPKTSSVTLKQNVYVTQGDNSFRGELVHLNKSEQTIIVPASNAARAIIVYNPNEKA